MKENNVFENASLELRRGVLLLAALSELREEGYGYSVQKSLSEKGLDIDQGTLYPLLRRLENQGMLDSAWRLEGDRPRRYYQLNESGQRIFEQLTKEWTRLSETINRILD